MKQATNVSSVDTNAEDDVIVTNIVTNENKTILINKIEKVLSKILSDKYNAKIKLVFTKKKA